MIAGLLLVNTWGLLIHGPCWSPRTPSPSVVRVLLEAMSMSFRGRESSLVTKNPLRSVFFNAIEDPHFPSCYFIGLWV